VKRAYADLRSIGGGREALRPAGETLATTDPAIAQTLLAKRIKEIEQRKRDKTILGIRRRTTLQQYAAEHLRKKAQAGKVTEETLENAERHLKYATRFFGGGRDLNAIVVADVQDYISHLAELPDRRGGTLSPGTQRKYLNSLSNMYRRAGGEGLVPPGYNPVAALMEKPSDRKLEAEWLEVWEAALLLEAARTYPYLSLEESTTGKRLLSAIHGALGEGERGEEEFVRRMRAAGRLTTMEKLQAYGAGSRIPARTFLAAAAAMLGVPTGEIVVEQEGRLTRYAYPLLATFLLTGGRETEVYGLEIGDVNLKRQTITFRPNRRRRLKTMPSFRSIPYFPQLQEILEPHLEARRKEGAGETDLLFVSPTTGGMLQNTRTMLDLISGRVGWEPGQVRSKAFRHTYCAARLQTLDGGVPVAQYTVAKEMGHGGDAMVKRIYGHLGEIRHRAPVVEYRIENQRDHIPAERLRLLLKAV
jgi:integrase